MAVNYYALVDEIAENERAFAYFKEHAFNFAGFSYIKLDDIRPCDMKEKLAELYWHKEFDLVYYFRDYPTYFLELNKYLLEKKLSSAEKSRSLAYRQRAIGIGKKTIDDISLSDVEDILFIMISSMREAWKNRRDKLDDFVLTDIELRLRMEDYKIILYTCDQALSIKFEYENNKKDDMLSILNSISPARKTQIYGLFGMLLLTHMLMERGEFEEG